MWLGFVGGRRRTSLLCREDVTRANVSPTWYAWLSRGAPARPREIANGLMPTEPEHPTCPLEDGYAMGDSPRPLSVAAPDVDYTSTEAPMGTYENTAPEQSVFDWWAEKIGEVFGHLSGKSGQLGSVPWWLARSYSRY